MVTATENSINTAFIDMTMSMEDGPREDRRRRQPAGHPARRGAVRRRPGFPNSSPGLEPITGVALGNATVSPINMANAYATLANGGRAAEPYIIEKVVDRQRRDPLPAPGLRHRGRRRRTSPPTSPTPSSRSSQDGSGTAALELDRPAAGKTGTATNGEGEVSSAWFAGYTPQLSTAGHVRPRQGQRAAAGLAPVVLRRRLPGRDLDRRDAAAPWRAAGRGVPGAGLRRRRRARRGPRAATRRRRRRRRPPTTQPPTQEPTTEEPTTEEPTDRGADDRAADADAADADRRRVRRRTRVAHAEPAADRRRRRPGTPAVAPADAAAAAALTAAAIRERYLGDRRGDRPGGHVHPTRDDPVVAALSEGGGGTGRGPAGRHPWWTPVRVLLALAALLLALGMVQKTSCYQDSWQNGSRALHPHVLLRPALPLHRARVRRAEPGPTATTPQVRDRYDGHGVPGRSSPTGRGARRGSTHWLSGVARPRDRLRRRRPATLGRRRTASRRESRLFVAVNAVGFAVLDAAGGLAARRRPPATALGRRAARGLTGAGADGADQLGPAGAGVRRRRAVGVGPRPAGAHRRDDRARHGRQALPAVPARRAARDLPARAPAPRLRRRGRWPPWSPGCWSTCRRYVSGPEQWAALLDVQLRPRRRPRVGVAGARPGDRRRLHRRRRSTCGRGRSSAPGACGVLVLGLRAPVDAAVRPARRC